MSWLDWVWVSIIGIQLFTLGVLVERYAIGPYMRRSNVKG